uniref:Cytochrome c oxidase subunit 3 n=1 Tax=Cephalodiscus hodgsoni TaxID=560606 RepID=A0A481P8B4_9BILA|nr:cytochrome c oxidase subunit 3 [Cephalodiscus hodgsoni]
MYQKVGASPWPFLGATGLWVVAVGFISYVFFHGWSYLFYGLFCVLCVAGFWWRDVFREVGCLGCGTSSVLGYYKAGFILFLISEAFLFFSFIWSYVHFGCMSLVQVGCYWPPRGVVPIDAWGWPFFGTCLLLSSGVSSQVAHGYLKIGDKVGCFFWMVVTVILGVWFVIVQGKEFSTAKFSMADTVFGGCFFIVTGCHGAHVLVGLVFLLVNLFRMVVGGYWPSNHWGFRAGLWYWHFVDGIWIVVWSVLYHWGGWDYVGF